MLWHKPDAHKTRWGGKKQRLKLCCLLSFCLIPSKTIKKSNNVWTTSTFVAGEVLVLAHLKIQFCHFRNHHLLTWIYIYIYCLTTGSDAVQWHGHGDPCLLGPSLGVLIHQDLCFRGWLLLCSGETPPTPAAHAMVLWAQGDSRR